MFKIYPLRWYACTFFGDDFFDNDEIPGDYAFSPIRVERFDPLKTGLGKFRLQFFHLNYPQGVMGKTYECQKLAHGETFLSCRVLGGPKRYSRFMILKEVTSKWLLMHFNERNLPYDLRLQSKMSLSEEQYEKALKKVRELASELGVPEHITWSPRHV